MPVPDRPRAPVRVPVQSQQNVHPGSHLEIVVHIFSNDGVSDAVRCDDWCQFLGVPAPDFVHDSKYGGYHLTHLTSF